MRGIDLTVHAAYRPGVSRRHAVLRLEDHMPGIRERHAAGCPLVTSSTSVMWLNSGNPRLRPLFAPAAEDGSGA
nr:MAG: hypothetical protein DIU68_13665 [Chloroflexota bacterium]